MAGFRRLASIRPGAPEVREKRFLRRLEPEIAPRSPQTRTQTGLKGLDFERARGDDFLTPPEGGLVLARGVRFQATGKRAGML